MSSTSHDLTACDLISCDLTDQQIVTTLGITHDEDHITEQPDDQHCLSHDPVMTGQVPVMTDQVPVMTDQASVMLDFDSVIFNLLNSNN